jgi:hypothetical protein
MNPRIGPLAQNATSTRNGSSVRSANLTRNGSSKGMHLRLGWDPQPRWNPQLGTDPRLGMIRGSDEILRSNWALSPV